METAGTLIGDALQEILVQASEQPIQANEAGNAIRYLNRMMASWQGEGINLGYTPITSLGDLVTIPETANDGVMLGLSLKLAPQYDIQISQQQFQNAKEAKDSIRNITIAVGPAPYPSTLPVGSGNEDTGWNNIHFYDEEQNSILAETTGQIVQEIGNV